jgi:hypothetical protein
VRSLAVVLAVLVCAAICTWLLAVCLCNYALVNTRSFDFVCGHNAPYQLLPSFLIFVAIFSLLARWLFHGGRRAGPAAEKE